jgi:hypothetical protein
VVLTPFALKLSPGSDASFTFAPDPLMAGIIERARLPPSNPSHLFRSVEGINTTRITSLTAPEAAASNLPARYAVDLG